MKVLFALAVLAAVIALVIAALRVPRLVRLWRARRADRRRPLDPRLPPETLEDLVRELLARRGFPLVEPVEPGVTVAERIRELAASVERHHAQGGLLVTPYHIDRALAEEPPAPLELMDGRALLRAVDRELPHRLGALRGFRLTGTERARSLDRDAVAG